MSPEKPLVNAPDITLYRGEIAAVIGPNGAGKTTLLKTLLDELPPLSGSSRLGAAVQPGYFAQAHEGLNPEQQRDRRAADGAPLCSRAKREVTSRSSCSPGTTCSARWRP